MRYYLRALLLFFSAMVGPAIALFATVDLQAAKSTVASNLRFVGVEEPPEWLLARAIDYWFLAAGVVVFGVWLWWVVHERPSKRPAYRQMLLAHYAKADEIRDLAFAAQTSGDITLIRTSFDALWDKALKDVNKQMGVAAASKLGDHSTSRFYPWNGEHTDQERAARSTLLSAINSFRDNVLYLVESDNLDP